MVADHRFGEDRVQTLRTGAASVIALAMAMTSVTTAWTQTPSFPPGPGYAGVAGSPDAWLSLLEMQAASMLSGGQQEVMAVLGRQFESALIRTALKHTHGRKNDAAVRLGIGRNTITRKIAELGIDGAKDD